MKLKNTIIQILGLILVFGMFEIAIAQTPNPATSQVEQSILVTQGMWDTDYDWTHHSQILLNPCPNWLRESLSCAKIAQFIPILVQMSCERRFDGTIWGCFEIYAWLTPNQDKGLRRSSSSELSHSAVR